MSYPDEFDRIHKALVKDAQQHPVYRDNTESAIYGYSEGVEHALDTMRIKGYRLPDSPEQHEREQLAQALQATIQSLNLNKDTQ